jgi:hypothetical protein
MSAETLSQEPLAQDTLPGPPASGGCSKPGQKRRRGAPPGNLNALKHGFYCRRFIHQKNDDLESALQEALLDETTLLRVQVRQLACFSKDGSLQDEAFQTLTAFGLCCTLLAMIMRAQRDLGMDGSPEAQALSKAIDEVFKS